jgi:serine/threonine protein kinase/tetratricopeptide (TPR) repeat protein
VSDAPADNAPKRPLRALFGWLKGSTPPPKPPGRVTSVSDHDVLPARLGHYAIERKLGEGGMGVVYAARDEKLQRTVALKTMASLDGDDRARQRFWREARAAASVNHPNVCQIYEIGEDNGVLFIAMELLEGEPLSARLKQGPMNVADTVSTGLSILAALSALHARGLVHRDLKPSNVFLTPYGLKLLDFGLARPTPQDDHATMVQLTHVGTVVGTPQYMAPEQALGEPVDARTDLFSAGALLFEMLAGRPAFVGDNVVAILHATVYEHPPALTGPPSVAAVDRVIRRALAKKPADRPASAEAMADELRDVRTADADAAVATRTFTRLVVLPFRVLRADPETDFLAFSLPDAITTSLSGIGSLVVRTSATAGRYAGEAPDFKTLAAEAGVDRVVMGTLVRSGDELRVVAQLVEAPSGTVIASHTVQSALGNLFQLQDDIAHRVVGALSLIGEGAVSPAPDAPANARAYELYLRANELARTYERMPEARDLFERSVALDPSFAPAWARLARCYRVIGKFIEPSRDGARRAEEALQRALELNPRLTVAHKIYANLEAEIGRGEHAIVRLLNEATRHGNDPELFSGLVHACRYCGLLDESLAAHAEARRLDPGISTGFEETILLTRDTERLLAVAPISTFVNGDEGIRVIGLGLAGRREEAKQLLAAITLQTSVQLFKGWAAHLSAWLEQRPADMLEGLEVLGNFAVFDDPEAIFQEGWLLCDAGEHARGLPFLERALARGYFAAPTLERSSQFDALRRNPAFQSLLADARAGRDRALAAFRQAGGERLLGR